MQVRNKGFLLADTMFGMALVVMLIGILGLAVNHHRTASTRLAHRRAASRLAEHTLASLTLGMPVSPAETEGDVHTSIVVRRVRDGEPVEIHLWIEVEVMYRRETVRLTGLAPDTAPLDIGD